MQEDFAVGLYLYHEGFYDAGQGRFITQDPLGFAGGQTNFYAYVGNDPVNGIDPLGLDDLVGEAAIDGSVEARAAPAEAEVGCISKALYQEVVIAALTGGALSPASITISAITCAASAIGKACFAAGTPLLTRRGWVPIELITTVDEVWSRPEDDPTAPGAWKGVEELFRTFAPIFNLHVGGEVIGTTAEHPFWVRGKGWTAAKDLTPGNLLSSHDGKWTPVEEVHDTQEWQPVYNLRVADYHTYFVGGEEWGFSVWAHNACSSTSGNNAASVAGRAKHTWFSNLMKSLGKVGSFTLGNGKRVDGLKFNKNGIGGIVYELKPNNPKAIARGTTQVAGYVAQLQKELGGIWRGIVIKY